MPQGAKNETLGSAPATVAAAFTKVPSWEMCREHGAVLVAAEKMGGAERKAKKWESGSNIT